jgi:putative transposase
MRSTARTGDGTSDGQLFAGRRYRLYLTPDQEQRAFRAAGCCRAIWNAALEQRRLAWELCGVSLWGAEQSAELPELKREPGFEWLGEDGIAQSLQQTLRDLDMAYRRFCAGLARRPRCKVRRRDESFRLPQGDKLPVRRLNRRWAEVRLPKLGWCRFRVCRPIGGEIRHATVTHGALGWHVSFCLAIAQRPAPPNGGPAVGVDLGVVATVALSSGELHHCRRCPQAKQSG